MADYRTNKETVADVARALAERIRWEMELGGRGYDPLATLPQSFPNISGMTATNEAVAASAAGRQLQGPKEVSDRQRFNALSEAAEEEASTTGAAVSAVPSGRTAPSTDVTTRIERPVSVPENLSSPSFSASAPSSDPDGALEALRAAIGECTRCALHVGRTRLVFGEGDPKSSLVFVGEGPGHDEDLAGRPFVGAAGQLLERIIQAMGLRRDTVYICNVVKCRPPKNRTPEPSEQKICGAFLRRQLSVIRPKVIVALGAVAAGYLLETDISVGRLRGRFHQMGDVSVMPTYHPAYLLRNPSSKRDVWEDMQQVMAALGIEQKRG